MKKLNKITTINIEMPEKVWKKFSHQLALLCVDCWEIAHLDDEIKVKIINSAKLEENG